MSSSNNIRACYLCQKEGRECDFQRPCRHCKKRRVPHMCMGLEVEERAKKLAHDAIAKARRERGSDLNQNSSFTPSTSALQVYDYSDHSIDEAHPETQQRAVVLLLNEMKKLKQDYYRMAQELHALKMRYEASEASKAGQRLIEADNSNSQRFSASSLAGNAAASTLQQVDTPTVLFDVTRSPAVVISCNETFCELFGLPRDQIVGSPWTRFVHPTYHERTVSLLQQRSQNPLQPSIHTVRRSGVQGTSSDFDFGPSKVSSYAVGEDLVSSIQFVQVYRTQQGRCFSALDTHTFFLDPHPPHHPRLDLLQLTPGLAAPLPSPTDRTYFAIAPTPATTAAAKSAIASILTSTAAGTQPPALPAPSDISDGLVNKKPVRKLSSSKSEQSGQAMSPWSNSPPIAEFYTPPSKRVKSIDNSPEQEPAPPIYTLPTEVTPPSIVPDYNFETSTYVGTATQASTSTTPEGTAGCSTSTFPLSTSGFFDPMDDFDAIYSSSRPAADTTQPPDATCTTQTIPMSPTYLSTFEDV